MSKKMEDILRNNDLEVILNPKQRIKKIFGSGKVIGIMVGDKARFQPSHYIDPSSGNSANNN